METNSEDTKAFTNETVGIAHEERSEDEFQVGTIVERGADGSPVSRVLQTDSAMRIDIFLNKSMETGKIVGNLEKGKLSKL